MNKRNLLGIAGARTVSVEIKIPNGANCVKCVARQPLKYRDTDFCALYGKELNQHSRRVWGERDVWGKPKIVWVSEKCEECLNGSQEYALTSKKKGGGMNV